MRRSDPAETPASGVSPASSTNGRPAPATRHGKVPNQPSRTAISKDRASPEPRRTCRRFSPRRQTPTPMRRSQCRRPDVADLSGDRFERGQSCEESRFRSAAASRPRASASAFARGEEGASQDRRRAHGALVARKAGPSCQVGGQPLWRWREHFASGRMRAVDGACSGIRGPVGPGFDQSRLVRRDDRLGAIAHAQLGEDPCHVGFDCRLAQI